MMVETLPILKGDKRVYCVHGALHPKEFRLSKWEKTSWRQFLSTMSPGNAFWLTNDDSFVMVCQRERSSYKSYRLVGSLYSGKKDKTSVSLSVFARDFKASQTLFSKLISHLAQDSSRFELISFMGPSSQESGGLLRGETLRRLPCLPASTDALRSLALKTGRLTTLEFDSIALSSEQATALGGAHSVAFRALKLSGMDLAVGPDADPLWPAVLLRHNETIHELCVWGDYDYECRHWMDHGFLRASGPIEEVDSSVDVFWPGIARLEILRSLSICVELRGQTLDRFCACPRLKELSIVVDWFEVGDTLGESLIKCLPHLYVLQLTPVYSSPALSPPMEFHNVWPDFTQLQQLRINLVIKDQDDWVAFGALVESIENIPSLKMFCVDGAIRGCVYDTIDDLSKNSKTLPLLWAARRFDSVLEHVRVMLEYAGREGEICPILDAEVMKQVDAQCFKNKCANRQPAIQKSNTPLLGLLVHLPEVEPNILAAIYTVVRTKVEVFAPSSIN